MKKAEPLTQDAKNDCGYQCFIIGGPFIAEDPACPIHGEANQMSAKKTKKMKRVTARDSANMTQMQLVFVSGVRRQRILLRAELMIIDHGDGFPTTVIEVVESQAKYVAAMVQGVRCHHGIGEVSNKRRSH